MKKLLSIITLLVLLVATMSAIPMKALEKNDEEVGKIIYWCCDGCGDNPIITTPDVGKDYWLEDGDFKFHKVNITNVDLVYLIAKYDYIVCKIEEPSGTFFYLETVIDDQYICYYVEIEE